MVDRKLTPTRMLCLIRKSLISCWLLAATGMCTPAVGTETVRLGGTGSALGTMRVLGEAYRKSNPQFMLDVVPNLGSSGGLKALERDAIQIAVTGRAVTPEEAARGLRSAEYGRTAFVLATSRRGVTGLTLAQIADIYSARVHAWPDGSPMRLVLRPATDGDSALLARFSPAVKEALAQAMNREGMVVGVTDQDSADEIVRLKGGLGTSSLALILSERRALHPVAIDGVAPTVKSLGDGSYPYSKALVVVTREKPPEAVARFLEFVRSADGRRILQETGHVVSAAR